MKKTVPLKRVCLAIRKQGEDVMLEALNKDGFLSERFYPQSVREINTVRQRNDPRKILHYTQNPPTLLFEEKEDIEDVTPESGVKRPNFGSNLELRKSLSGLPKKEQKLWMKLKELRFDQVPTVIGRNQRGQALCNFSSMDSNKKLSNCEHSNNSSEESQKFPSLYNPTFFHKNFNFPIRSDLIDRSKKQNSEEPFLPACSQSYIPWETTLSVQRSLRPINIRHQEANSIKQPTVQLLPTKPPNHINLLDKHSISSPTRDPVHISSNSTTHKTNIPNFDFLNASDPFKNIYKYKSAISKIVGSIQQISFTIN